VEKIGLHSCNHHYQYDAPNSNMDDYPINW